VTAGGRSVRDVTLSSPAGALRALHDAPEAPWPRHGPRAAVVCHPHPLHGGTMDNKVVFTVARALREHGVHVLRFNFRGAGGSEGEHDHGRGELDDARAAIDHAARLAGPEPDSLLVAGFSFGSYVGLTVALDDSRVGALLAIAPPVNHYDFSAIAAARQPLTVVYSDADELVPAHDVEDFIASCARPPRVVRVTGSSHLFHGHLREIRHAVQEMLGALP
jgi:uncharacterized protein